MYNIEKAISKNIAIGQDFNYKCLGKKDMTYQTIIRQYFDELSSINKSNCDKPYIAKEEKSADHLVLKGIKTCKNAIQKRSSSCKSKKEMMSDWGRSEQSCYKKNPTQAGIMSGIKSKKSQSLIENKFVKLKTEEWQKDSLQCNKFRQMKILSQATRIFLPKLIQKTIGIKKSFRSIKFRPTDYQDKQNSKNYYYFNFEGKKQPMYMRQHDSNSMHILKLKESIGQIKDGKLICTRESMKKFNHNIHQVSLDLHAMKTDHRSSKKYA